MCHTKSKPISIHLLNRPLGIGLEQLQASAPGGVSAGSTEKRVFHSAVDGPGLLQPWSHVLNSQNKKEPSAMDVSGLVVAISYKMQVMSVRESPPAERSVESGNLSVGERLSKPELFSVRGR
jgi:hypothetical protein